MYTSHIYFTSYNNYNIVIDPYAQLLLVAEL